MWGDGEAEVVFPFFLTCTCLFDCLFGCLFDCMFGWLFFSCFFGNWPQVFNDCCKF